MSTRLLLLSLLTVLPSGCKQEEPRVRIKKIEKLPSKEPLPTRPRRYKEQVQHDPEHVLGGEQGVDHVGVAVKDLAGARAAYEKLGFGNGQEGRLPNGLNNVNFYFGDTTYLELVTYYDKKKNPWVASFVDRHENGAMFLMLCVFSYTHTANLLRRKGFKVSDPFPGRIETKGAAKRGLGRGKAPTWVTFLLDGQRLPGNVTFIAYTRRLRSFMLSRLKDEKLRRRAFSHPNTALGLRTAWIAVPDLKKARKIFEAIGLEAGRRVEVKELEARGLEVKAGQGTLVLLEPARAKKGPTAGFLARRGEGLIGLGFEVERLETARAYIEEHTGLALQPRDGLLGQSILIPADKAYDVWIELFERKPAQ